MRVFLVLISLFFAISYNAFSQEKTLSIEELYNVIKKYHPIVKQSDILLEKAKMQVRTARGGFDPKAYRESAQKDFKDKEYFNIRETGIKIPTWYGVTLKTAFEKNEGYYLNNERTVPEDGLGIFGASITLGKGLLMDDRRATLRKAQVYTKSSEQERELLLNQLFFDATYAFYQWQLAFQNLEALNEAKLLSYKIVENVKRSFELGSMPAIDTLEAFVQLQSIENDLITAQSELAYTKNMLSNFI